jgi:hypothetical protein
MNLVRELTPGDRPRDWTDSTAVTNDGNRDGVNANRDGVNANRDGVYANRTDAGVVNRERDGVDRGEVEDLNAGDWGRVRRVEGAAPARLTPQRYKLRFTASDETWSSSSKRRRSSLIPRRTPASRRSTCEQCAPSWPSSSNRSTP